MQQQLDPEASNDRRVMTDVANTLPNHPTLDDPSPFRISKDDPRRSILDQSPSHVVDLALDLLQQAGIEVTEWRALLYRRMQVPRVVRDFSYVISDDQIERACNILNDLGLIRHYPSSLETSHEGEMCLKGHFYRITRSTLLSSVQCLVLYPLSFTCLLPSDLRVASSYHIRSSTLCKRVFVPNPCAVYTSLIRMFMRYPRGDPTRGVIQTDLEELLLYHLLGYEDSKDTDEDESEDERHLLEAHGKLAKWKLDAEWGIDEEWFGDALGCIIDGRGKFVHLPTLL